MAEEKITKDMTVDDVMVKYPETEKVFHKYFSGACFGCPMAKVETIEAGALVHGKDPEEVLKELNDAVAKEEGKK